jgi:hypothetical protein
VKHRVFIGELMAIGRISGQLLKSNLLRGGENLAFETDLLYLDVVNSRIGIKTASPTADLDVNGTIKTTDVLVDNQLSVGDISITGNTINSSSSTINFTASAGQATVYHARLQIDDFEIAGNTISTIVSNSPIELRPNGTGTVDILANTNITGNLNVTGSINATGNVTIGGNIIIGDDLSDTITINASIRSSLIPETDIIYDLGSSSFRWRTAFLNNFTASNGLTLGTFTFSGNTLSSTASSINFNTPAGNSVIFNSKILVGDFEIAGNSISTTVSNSSVDINPNGTGTIELEANTNVTGNLAVSGNINAVGNVTIGGNIIIGDALTDNLVINASIKSDLVPETDNIYDLGSPTFRWRAVYAGQFFTNSVVVPALDVGNLMFRDNEITTTTGQDLYIDGNGAGGVRLGNFRIVDNVITNVSANAVTEIAQSGIGYFKLQGTNGFVPPVGSDAQRPTLAGGYAFIPIGMTRFNSTSRALEVWDGITWASPAGSSGAVSVSAANDIAAEWALTLG